MVKTKQLIIPTIIFLVLFLAVSGFFAINGSDEAARRAGAFYFLGAMGVLLILNLWRMFRK